MTDTFYFVHRPLAGNGSITARVTSLTGLLPHRDGRPGPARRPGPGSLHPGAWNPGPRAA